MLYTKSFSKVQSFILFIVRETHRRHDVVSDVIKTCLFSMMQMSRHKAAEIVQLYLESRSPISVIRMMQKRYPGEDKLSKLQVCKVVKRFKLTGSVEDRRHRNPGRPKLGRSAENVEEVRRLMAETPQKSVRKVLGDITNECMFSRVYRILRFDLKLFPYTISVMQHLKQSDIESRLDFATWMKDRLNILDRIWFSDEFHFHLNAVVNKQNCRFWGKENQTSIMKILCTMKRLLCGLR